MSLDVYLESDQDVDTDEDELFWGNITHNLNTMADAAGIYQALWRPEEIGVTTANQLIPLLEDGLSLLISTRRVLEKFNPANGWGDYEGLVRFVKEYLNACHKYPSAKVRVSR
jgi:hypothetical protein